MGARGLRHGEPLTDADRPSPPRWTLRTGVSWGGLEVPSDEQAEVVLELAPDQLSISVESPYHGNPAPEVPVGPTPGLWNHEVVELFLAEAFPLGEPRYLEIELSPHGHWLAWRFHGARRRASPDPVLHYQAERERSRWRGRAILARGALPAPPWGLLATALHDTPRRRRHLLSTSLPGERPDFHQPRYFVEADSLRSRPRALETHYEATEYRVSDPSLAFRIGRSSPPLDRLCRERGVERWAFVTAWNPGSVPDSLVTNEKRQGELIRTLVEAGWEHRPGSGVPLDDGWEPEPSWLVLGPSPAEALALARRFGQNAVVVGGLGQAPRLLWTLP